MNADALTAIKSLGRWHQLCRDDNERFAVEYALRHALHALAPEDRVEAISWLEAFAAPAGSATWLEWGLAVIGDANEDVCDAESAASVMDAAFQQRWQLAALLKELQTRGTHPLPILDSIVTNVDEFCSHFDKLCVLLHYTPGGSDADSVKSTCLRL